jgi:large subunit ribosomal protein L6
LSFDLPTGVTVALEDTMLQVSCDSVELWNLRGTTRAIIAHMIHGVHTGYTKSLQVIGVGFDAALQGSDLNFKL